MVIVARCRVKCLQGLGFNVVGFSVLWGERSKRVGFNVLGFTIVGFRVWCYICKVQCKVRMFKV
jgi:hypothetical protein